METKNVGVLGGMWGILDPCLLKMEEQGGRKGGRMMGARQKKSQDIFYVKELV